MIWLERPKIKARAYFHKSTLCIQTQARDREKCLMSDNHVKLKFLFSISSRLRVSLVSWLWISSFFRKNIPSSRDCEVMKSHVVFLIFTLSWLLISGKKCMTQSWVCFDECSFLPYQFLCFNAVNLFLFQAAAGLDLKDSLAGGPWPYPPVYAGYDSALAGYHFNG